MSILAVCDENGVLQSVTSDFQTIVNQLISVGVLFERWQTGGDLKEDARQENILDSYQEAVNRLMIQYEFKSADVVSMFPNHPNRAELRSKFLDEHTHSDFEVRFFVAGHGLFFIHVIGQVYGVLCEQGDLISVPSNTKHWFDMGESPQFKCIRLFSTPEGWIANYTGSHVGKLFPKLEDFIALHGTLLDFESVI